MPNYFPGIGVSPMIARCLKDLGGSPQKQFCMLFTPSKDQSLLDLQSDEKIQFQSPQISFPQKGGNTYVGSTNKGFEIKDHQTPPVRSMADRITNFESTQPRGLSKETPYEEGVKSIHELGRSDHHIFGSLKHPDSESVLSAKTTPVKAFIRADQQQYSRTEHKPCASIQRNLFSSMAPYED